MSVLLTKAVQEQQLQIDNILQELGISSSQLSNLTQSIGSQVAVRTNELTGTIKVKGAAVFGGDSVGQARILAGDSKVVVKFSEPYEYQPIVTATLRGNSGLSAFINWSIIDETNEGFEIHLNGRHYETLEFNWHAFGAYESKIFVSNGDTQDIKLVVKESSTASTSVAIPPTTEAVAGDTTQDGTVPVEETVVTVVDSIEEVTSVTEPSSTSSADEEVIVQEPDSEDSPASEEPPADNT